MEFIGLVEFVGLVELIGFIELVELFVFFGLVEEIFFHSFQPNQHNELN